MEIEKIIKILNKKYKVEPLKEPPFKVLISTILSQRTKDELTRLISKKLLSKYNKPEKILSLKEEDITKIIYPVGFYRQKAKRILQTCKILVEKYEGKVPKKREELLKLPGVGGKTADIVLSYGYGVPVIGIDVHCAVISRRLGLTKSNNPEKIREDLHKIIPDRLRLMVNLLFIRFGKDICRTKKPRCDVCPIYRFCKYKNNIQVV